MPAAIISKEEVLDRLLEVFRQKGYDGASLADIADATGLGKSSLYHHFPDGKVDMARQVLDRLAAILEEGLFAPLRTGKTPSQKLNAMLDTISAFYDEGRKACLLERLCASVEQRGFRRPLNRAFEKWIDHVEELAREAGVSKTQARARAEDFVVRIEGALVVAAGTGDPAVFTRTLADLRRTLLSRDS